MIFIVAGFVLCVVAAVVWCSLTVADKAVIFARSKSIEFGGAARTYRLYVPRVINSDTKLIFGFDGFGGSGRRFAYYTALHNVASDAIVVYPDPLPPQKRGQVRGWNAGFCCGSGWVEGVDDVGYVLALREQIIAEYGLSKNTTYAVGFSNGAFLVERLAAEYPDEFQAVAVMAGTLGTVDHQLNPTKPISILLAHGEQDEVIPFAGGSSPNRNREFIWASYEDAVKRWQSVAAGKAEVRQIVLPDAGHEWPGWRRLNIWHRKPKMTLDIMKFFDEVSRP